jgi:hypothetical protein
MASLTSFTVQSTTNNSATFLWTYQIDQSDPQAEAYTLSLQVVNGQKIDVTYAALPYTLTGLRSGTHYEFELLLLYGGSSISQIVQNVTTTGSAPVTPPTSSQRVITAFNILAVSWSAIKFSYTLSGTDSYKLIYSQAYLTSQPVDVTSQAQPVTVQGLPPKTTLNVTLTCTSNGKSTSITHSVTTPAAPPITPPTPTTLPSGSRTLVALNTDTHINTADIPMVIIMYLGADQAAFLLSLENGRWNAVTACGGSYHFNLAGASQHKTINATSYTLSARVFGVNWAPGNLNKSGTLQEATNRNIGFPIPPPLTGTWIAQAAVASASNDTLDIFTLGTNANIYHTREVNGAFQPFGHIIGGPFTGIPVAVVSGPDRIELLAVLSPTFQLIHATVTFNNNVASVTGWTETGATVHGNVSACSRSTGNLDVICLGTDLAPYYASYSGGKWSSWLNLGGKSNFGMRPAICSSSPNRLDCALVGTDSQYYHKWFDGKTWFPSATGWEGLQATTEDIDAALVATGSNQLLLVGADQNGTVVTRALSGTTWAAWVTHTGTKVNGQGDD